MAPRIAEGFSLTYCDDCLQENAMNYDKGVLAEILEPIMGKGLIPADLETWKAQTGHYFFEPM